MGHAQNINHESMLENNTLKITTRGQRVERQFWRIILSYTIARYYYLLQIQMVIDSKIFFLLFRYSDISKPWKYSVYFL